MQTNTTYSKLEQSAIAEARTTRAHTQNFYIKNGGSTKLTPERSVAEALEANPEVYESFREQHNAKGMVEQLRRAGYKLQAA